MERYPQDIGPLINQQMILPRGTGTWTQLTGWPSWPYVLTDNHFRNKSKHQSVNVNGYKKCRVIVRRNRNYRSQQIFSNGKQKIESIKSLARRQGVAPGIDTQRIPMKHTSTLHRVSLERDSGFSTLVCPKKFTEMWLLLSQNCPLQIMKK